MSNRTKAFAFTWMVIVLAVGGAGTLGRAAQVRLPACFGNKMVLQRPLDKRPTRIWCWSDTNGLSIEIGGLKEDLKKEKGNIWSYSFKKDELKTGGPHKLRIVHHGKKNAVVELAAIDEVYVGELWVWGAQPGSLKLRTNGGGNWPAQLAQTQVFWCNGTGKQAALSTDGAHQPWQPCTPGTAPAALCFLARNLIGKNFIGSDRIPVGILALPAREINEFPKQNWPLEPIWGNVPFFMDSAGYKSSQEMNGFVEELKASYQTELDQLKLLGKVPSVEAPPHWNEVHDFERAYWGQITSLSPLSFGGVIW